MKARMLLLFGLVLTRAPNAKMLALVWYANAAVLLF